uniref:TPR_REGION domain-containing protein n=1 Tax=Mesocestoides corti TaxID=53468 RepID=A0A5K3FAZ3_MESCO
MEQKRESAAEAKTCLEKALQIDPGLSDAWCELAEHEWMLCEPERAVAPLQTTLKLNKQNADALWRLSMLLRQLPAESTAKRALFECSELLDLLAPGGSSKDSLSVSLRLAHAAVKADPTSGRAWECLGNALLTAFLSGPPDKTAGFIGRSLAAFTQASKHPSVVAQPHFHYNRAAALHYKDDFSGALVSWLRAGLLDPAWPAPRASATRCLRAFRKMDAIVHTQAEDFDKTTRKRIASLISSLAPCLAADGGQPLAKLLGPFRPRKQGSKSAAVTSTIPDLEFRLFKDLKTGNNFGKVVCGGVVTSLPSDSDLALNLLLVDAEGSFLVLRIHQISKV